MDISVLKFDATAKKVGVTIEIEDIKDPDVVRLLNLARSGHIVRIQIDDE